MAYDIHGNLIDPQIIKDYINKKNMENQNKIENPTFGQKAVGINFNPSQDNAVDRIKQIMANAIDEINNFRNMETTTPDAKRHASIAITEMESAQMRAVKALTWKD